MAGLTDTFELHTGGITIARRTVTKILRSLSLHRRRFIDPNGENNRKPQVIIAKRPGQMVHVDVKKVGNSRTTAGGAPTVAAPHRPNDPSSARRSEATSDRLRLPAFRDRRQHSFGVHRGQRQRNRSNGHRFMNNAQLFFAAHGINRIERLIADNGSCYRATDFTSALREARRYRIKPYTPKHNGKVERYNHIRAEELLYSREQQRRTTVEVWNSALIVRPVTSRSIASPLSMIGISPTRRVRGRNSGHIKVSGQACPWTCLPGVVPQSDDRRILRAAMGCEIVERCVRSRLVGAA